MIEQDGQLDASSIGAGNSNKSNGTIFYVDSILAL